MRINTYVHVSLQQGVFNHWTSMALLKVHQQKQIDKFLIAAGPLGGFSLLNLVEYMPRVWLFLGVSQQSIYISTHKWQISSVLLIPH